MAVREVGRLIVKLVADLREYRADWEQAARTTKEGADKLTQATKPATDAVDKLTQAAKPAAEALDKMTGAMGGQAGAAVEAAKTTADVAKAAAAVTGASGALVAAVGLGAAALGTLAVAAAAGYRENQRLQDSLLLTGNYAGVVAGQVDRMAMNMAASIGGKVGASREVLAALVATGRFTTESVLEVGTALQLVARYSGQTNAQVLGHFTGMADGVAKWAAKANEGYHFLDIATYRYIQRLEDQGQKQEAMRVASEALSAHLGGDLRQNLGYIERAWHEVGVRASEAWDAMKKVGKPETTQDVLAASSAYLAGAQRGWLANTPGGQAQVEQMKVRNLELQRRSEREQRAATDRTAYAQATEEAIKADQEWARITDVLATKQERLAAELKKARDVAERRAKAPGQTEAELARIQAQLAETERRIQEKYAEKGKTGRPAAEIEADRQRKLLAELSGVQASYMEQLADLNKLRLAGNVTEERYVELVGELIAKQPMARKLIQDQAREQERLNKADQEAGRARERYLQELDRGTEKLQDETERELEHARTLGLSKQALAERTAAKLEDKATSLELRAIREYDKNLDEAIYDLTMRQVVALRERAAAARTRAAADTDYEERQKAERETLDIVRDIDQTGRRVFADMATNGEDAFKSIGRAAQTELVDLLYRLTLRPFVINGVLALRGAMGLGGNVGSLIETATGGGTGGGLLGNLGALTGLGSLGSFGTAAGYGAAALFNGTGLTALSGGASMLGAGSVAQGLGMMAGVLGPIAIGLGVVSALAKKFKGETRQGGQYVDGQLIAAPSGGEIGEFGQASAQMRDAINATLANIGSSARVHVFQSGIEQSAKDKGFAYGGGVLTTGQAFGQGWGEAFPTDGWMNRRGSMTAEEAAAAGAEELQQAWLQALQVIADAPEKIRARLAGLDIDALQGDALKNLVAEIEAMIQSVGEFRTALQGLPFEDLANRTFDLTQKLLDATGGQAGTLLGSYFGNYYSPAEQRAQTVRNIQRVLAGAGANFTEAEIDRGDKGKFRELTEYYRTRTDDAGIRIFGALLQVNEAFSSLAPVVEAVADAAQDAGDNLNDAWRAFDRAMQIERDRAQAAVSAAQEAADAEQARLEVVKAGRLELLGQVDSTRAWLAAQGRGFIAQQLAAAQGGGLLAGADQMQEAVRAAIAGISADDYATQFEYDRARLVLAGQLQQLEDVSGTRLTAAQQQLQAAQAQLRSLDDLLEEERRQTEAITDGFMTLIAATERLNRAQGQPAAAVVGGGLSVSAAAAGGASFGGGAVSAGAYQLVTSLGLPVDLAGYAMAHLNDPQAIAAYTMRNGGTMADLARALNKSPADVETWFNLQGVPSFASGIDRVPYDMVSVVHADEAVLRRDDAAEWRAGRAGGVSPALANVLDRLAKAMEDVGENTRKTASTLAGEGGVVIDVRVVTV